MRCLTRGRVLDWRGCVVVIVIFISLPLLCLHWIYFIHVVFGLLARGCLHLLDVFLLVAGEGGRIAWYAVCVAAGALSKVNGLIIRLVLIHEIQPVVLLLLAKHAQVPVPQLGGVVFKRYDFVLVFELRW